MTARPRLNRSGCFIVVLTVVVVIGMLIWIDTQREPKSRIDAVAPMEGRAPADVG